MTSFLNSPVLLNYSLEFLRLLLKHSTGTSSTAAIPQAQIHTLSSPISGKIVDAGETAGKAGTPRHASFGRIVAAAPAPPLIVAAYRRAATKMAVNMAWTHPVPRKESLTVPFTALLHWSHWSPETYGLCPLVKETAGGSIDRPRSLWPARPCPAPARPCIGLPRGRWWLSRKHRLPTHTLRNSFIDSGTVCQRRRPPSMSSS